MRQKIKLVAKLVLKRLKVLQVERREMAAFKQFQLAQNIRLGQAHPKVAMIGCGIMGRFWARTIKDMPNWDLVAIYDLQETAAQRVQREIIPGTKICSSVEDLFKYITEEKDGILIIASTATSHIPLTQKALDYGITHILLEKPVATNLAQAKQLMQATTSANAVINVNHIRRWVAPLGGLKRILATKVIGKIHSLHYNFGRAGFAMIGTHLFDLSRWLFDSEISKVRGALDTVERANMRGAQYKDPSGRCEFYLENGIHVTLDLSDALPLQQDSFTLYGESGRIEVDQRIGNIRMIGSSGKIWEELFPWHDSFHNSLGLSLFELHQKVAPRCSVEDGVKALEAAIAVHHSHRNEGQWVSLPLEGEILNETFPFA